LWLCSTMKSPDTHSKQRLSLATVASHMSALATRQVAGREAQEQGVRENKSL
jgi:hypothetical protein